MKYAVVFSSLTGNTKLLAEEIRKEKGKEDCVCFGEPDERVDEADIIYAGFWTDKGSCDEKMRIFLNGLHEKTICLFGTAGFGKDASYFARILANVKKEIPDDNTVGDAFMCQGKMQMAVRKRYEAILEQDPEDEKAKMLIENFDIALSHPDEEDIKEMKKWLAD